LKLFGICITFLSITVLFSGCGGSASVKTIPFSDVSLEMKNGSLIYVYQERATSSLHTNVRISDSDVVLMPGTYYPFFISAGEVKIKYGFPYADKHISIHLSPGETVYVKTTSNRKTFGKVKFETDCEPVPNQVGSKEIQNCILGVLRHGLERHPVSFIAPKGSSEGKAVLFVYRAPNALYEASIGGYNLGIYSDNGREMIGFAINECETIKQEVSPGLIKLVKGNVATSDTGKAAFALAGMITGLHTQTIGSEFTEIETGLKEKKLSFNFQAQAEQAYYIEIDPISGRFIFTSPDGIKEKCLHNPPKIIQHRNGLYVRKMIENTTATAISWSYMDNSRRPLLYSNVESSGGILDYLVAKIATTSKDKDLKSALEKIDVESLLDEIYVKPMMQNLKDDNIPSIVMTSVNKGRPDQNVRFVFTADIKIFGITSKHVGIFPFVTSKQPAAITSIKGTVKDKFTGKILFQKPFNGISLLSEDLRETENLFQLCETKLKESLNQAIIKFLDDSYLSLR
jgi:hypothetical protein